ncbi:MAG: hypothetical protein ABW032_09800 [Burkholderiaceae bacterium]
MTHNNIGTAKSPSDQKTLNEELIDGLVDVAQRNPQHAVELFGIPLGVAMRLAAMPDAQLDDLATTPVALWRPALTERLVRRLPERQPMLTPDHEVYRPLVKRINRLALATFVRYADDPASAALVCDLSDPDVIRALQDLPAFAFLEWAGNPGALLIAPRLGDALIDRLLRDDEGVEPRLRGLVALTQCCEQEYASIRETLQREVQAHRTSTGPVVGKRPGRPPSNFLMPQMSTLILTMLRHQMRPTEVEERLLAITDVRAAQLRGVAEALHPKPKRDKGAPRDRTRDHRDLWGSAGRRLSATAIFRLQRRLVNSGIDPFEAMVRAYDYYAVTYDADCGVSLSRLLKDVFSPMQQGIDTHLSHCGKCGVVHLSHEEKSGIIECPVCVLARAGKLGQRRSWADKLDPVALRGSGGCGAWPGGGSWPAALAADASPTA